MIYKVNGGDNRTTWEVDISKVKFCHTVSTQDNLRKFIFNDGTATQVVLSCEEFKKIAHAITTYHQKNPATPAAKKTDEEQVAEIIKTPEEIAVPDELALEQAIHRAERNEALVSKITTISLKHTNSADWVDIQGKPYLQASGAEKIARLFGVSWRICTDYPQKKITEDENGKYYMYIYKGEFKLAGKSIEAVGTCSQKDHFFGTRGGAEKPLSEIDECNIVKKAYTNMLGRGVTTILGIRNLTWDEVKAAGLNKNSTPKVTYAQGSKGGTAQNEITGIVSNFKTREGVSKAGKAYKILAFDLTDKAGKIHHINTFDAKEIDNDFEVKASFLEVKEYKGEITYMAKTVEIVSENIDF